MKKILLTAIVALIGMSAWAAKPEAGTKGYLYNAAAGKFIGADAKLSDTGQEFEIYFKSADSKNPNEEFPDRGFGAYPVGYDKRSGISIVPKRDTVGIGTLKFVRVAFSESKRIVLPSGQDAPVLGQCI